MATASAARWMVLSRASPAEPGREAWEAESLRPGAGFHRGGSRAEPLGFTEGGEQSPASSQHLPEPLLSLLKPNPCKELQGLGLDPIPGGVQGTLGSPLLLLVPQGSFWGCLGEPGPRAGHLESPQGKISQLPWTGRGPWGLQGPALTRGRQGTGRQRGRSRESSIREENAGQILPGEEGEGAEGAGEHQSCPRPRAVPRAQWDRDQHSPAQPPAPSGSSCCHGGGLGAQ